MRRFLVFNLLVGLFVAASTEARQIERIEPLFWWSGMKNPELQLMVYGENIAAYKPSINYPGIYIKSTVSLESPNYLLLYLDI